MSMSGLINSRYLTHSSGAVSAVLLPWYFCNILWCLAALPCSQYSEMFFWEMAKDAAPCEAFNFTSSFLCCLLTMSFCSRLVMPLALRIRWTMLVHARLQDIPSPGLSEEQLELISSSIEIMGATWSNCSAKSIGWFHILFHICRKFMEMQCFMDFPTRTKIGQHVAVILV